MLDQVRQEADAKSFYGAACLVAGLVLIEAPVRVSRGLADVKAPAATPARVMQQNDVDRVTRAVNAECLRSQA